MAKTMPPLAVESSFVRTMPVSPIISWKTLACDRPFWPVVASRTKRTSGLRSGNALVDDAPHLCQLVHQVRLRVEPSGCVGDDDVDVAGKGRVESVVDDGRRIRSRSMGHELAPVTIGPDSSWSIAAARNVSAAASRTDAFSARYRWASLPMVVVLPVPLTPTIRRTAGSPASADPGRQPARRAAAVLPARPVPRLRPMGHPCGALALATTSMASSPPTSPEMSNSSTDSQSAPRTALQDPSQPRHEAAAASFEARRQVARRLFGRRSPATPAPAAQDRRFDGRARLGRSIGLDRRRKPRSARAMASERLLVFDSSFGLRRRNRGHLQVTRRSPLRSSRST